mgnify:FL=1
MISRWAINAFVLAFVLALVSMRYPVAQGWLRIPVIMLSAFSGAVYLLMVIGSYVDWVYQCNRPLRLIAKFMTTG